MISKPTNTPLVSIIIPTYNRADLIKETLGSVQNQIYQNWECIVVDDGSEDDTEKILDKYINNDARIKYVKRPNNYLSGGNGARNYGFDLSEGEFVQWFDSDDIMNADFISSKIEVFDRHPEVQSVICRFSFFDGFNETPNQLGFEEVYPEFIENMLTVKIPVWTPSIMFRKSFLIKTQERFDENLKRLQEYEFFARILIKFPHEKYLLDKILCLIREHENAKTYTFKERKEIEMYETLCDAHQKIISLLVMDNKFTHNLQTFFLKDHIKYISISRKLGYDKVEKKLNRLVNSYLMFNKNYFKLIRYKIGYFLFDLFPVQNFFLIYEVNNPILLGVARNSKRIYKIVFKRGYLKEKIIQKN